MLITTRKHPDGATLIKDIKTYGAKMQEAKPLELAIGGQGLPAWTLCVVLASSALLPAPCPPHSAT